MYLIEILHQTTTPPYGTPNAPWLYLIEILHQTTTCQLIILHRLQLYLIEILHQTTTPWGLFLLLLGLYLIEILHQTTTSLWLTRWLLCCILSKFYIKPQQCSASMAFSAVVSYRNSTSNHNLFGTNVLYNELYLIEILHQTTTLRVLLRRPRCCILSKFYIKPQLARTQADIWRGCILSKFYIKPQLQAELPEGWAVVSYRNSTSNHNISPLIISLIELYLIEILHQTTTIDFINARDRVLYLIEILHQTTTPA